MTKKLWVVPLTALALVAPSKVWTQETQPDTAVVRVATEAMMGDLRSYVVAQESFYANNNTYARFLRQLDYQSSRGVTVVMLTATSTGHSAIAIHVNVPGMVCALYVGSGNPPLSRGAEGDVVCRGP